MSDELYAQKLEDEKLLVHCKHCDQDIDFRTITKLDVFCNKVEELLTGELTKNIWVCSLCKKENLTKTSEFTKAKLPNPYYLGVVPDPPSRKDGILDRFTYHKKIEHWCWTMIGELEFKAALFRDDSWQKAIDAGYDILMGGEEEDKG